MKIGSVELKSNVLFAPIAGFSDYPARKICKKYGVALTYTEMVSAKALYYGDKKTQKLLEAEDDLCAVQIFGREPSVMCYAAKLLEERGFPVIDINMGCPAPKIVNNGEGSVLLKEPDLAVNIVESIKNTVKIPVTVKMRKGWNSCPNAAVELSKRLDSVGVDAICIHGRTREQYYSGDADWDIIAEIKQSVKCPVIGNGDVTDIASYNRMLEKTGCDAVMIARAACSRPWIFEECISGKEKNMSIEEKLQLIMHHYELSVDFYGEHMAIPQMRKQFHCYIKGLPGASKLKNDINSINTYNDVKKFLESLICDACKTQF